MDDNANGVAQTVDEDLNTTAPNPPLEWQMPAPVFRRTSGRYPQGFEKEFEKAKAERAASVPEPAIEVAPETSKTETPTPEPTPKGSTLKLVLVLLGLAAMIGFLIVFISVVYFFFLR